MATNPIQIKKFLFSKIITKSDPNKIQVKLVKVNNLHVILLKKVLKKNKWMEKKQKIKKSYLHILVRWLPLIKKKKKLYFEWKTSNIIQSFAIMLTLQLGFLNIKIYTFLKL